MTTNYNLQFKRRMSGPERVLLMMPFNVVMVARIQDSVDVERLASVLDGLRKRHALLAVRVVIDKDDVAEWVVCHARTLLVIIGIWERMRRTQAPEPARA